MVKFKATLDNSKQVNHYIKNAYKKIKKQIIKIFKWLKKELLTVISLIIAWWALHNSNLQFNQNQHDGSIQFIAETTARGKQFRQGYSASKEQSEATLKIFDTYQHIADSTKLLIDSLQKRDEVFNKALISMHLLPFDSKNGDLMQMNDPPLFLSLKNSGKRPGILVSGLVEFLNYRGQIISIFKRKSLPVQAEENIIYPLQIESSGRKNNSYSIDSINYVKYVFIKVQWKDVLLKTTFATQNYYKSGSVSKFRMMLLTPADEFTVNRINKYLNK